MTPAVAGSMRPFAAAAALLGGLGVILGAFGAHTLRGSIDEAALQVWRTAVDYQFWHVLALLAISLSSLPVTRWLRAAAFAFLIGIVLFSGSLYALSLGAPHLIGVVTPLGGVALICAWTFTAVALLHRNR